MFNNFTDTIFIKKSSELEKQVKALKELRKEYPDNKKIAKELDNCTKGLYGENEIIYELENANIGMCVLHDVNLKIDDLKAQIDFIIITPAVNYYVECKNISGNIIINKNGDFIRESGRKRIGIESPLRQAERHLEVIGKVRNKNINSSTLQKLI